jgi:predicted phage terminase large subunit-like protein
MLVLYRYEDEFYCVDCVCDDNVNFDVQSQKCANLLFRHNVQQAEFESNNGGERVAADVEKVLQSMGGFTNITTKPTETNKETRIIVNADWVKKHILFRMASTYQIKDDYGQMVSWLCRYSIVGKNPHDDVPDCFANAALYFSKGQQKNSVSAVLNPFRSRGGLG